MKRDGDRIRYHATPDPLGWIPTAEKLSIAEAAAALKREPTASEIAVAVAVCHLYAPRIMDLEASVATLTERLMDLHRGTG